MLHWGHGRGRTGVAATKKSSFRFMLTTLVVVYFVSYINVNLHIPLLVSLAEEFGTSVGDIAQVSVAISLPWAFLAPLIGPISDRYGRKPVLLSGLSLLAFSGLLSSFAWDYTSLLVLRFVGG